ncbi:MCE family protein [Mycobacterium sp. pV006]|uniref:MCE family protein n=1 Tax=Mycobacterium sp. pV006 TaxID=3238983 RepID=UPI00351B3263
MIDRLTRVQLGIFALVTVITVGITAVFYLQVPAALGIGVYNVTANFAAGGGIYQNANVTYRGVTIGRVESVGLTDDAVVARMRLNSGTPVPANVTATVKSMSAIGEQYIDLVPPDDVIDQEMLADGADIGLDRTAIGQDIAGLLDEADALVTNISNTGLQDLLRESFAAFNGSGPELARMIESARLLVDEANANYEPVEQLIDQAGPLLAAQIRSGDDIRSLADGLARLTTEVANADPQLRTTLQTAPGTIDVANETFTGIRPSFPMLAANLANAGRVGVIYRKSIEQSLVIFPALFAALLTVGGGVPGDEGGKLDFKIDLGDPPPCSVGFIPPTQIRSPADTTVRELPTDLYCKVPHNDPSVVRGARNYPCQEFPGKRAPTRRRRCARRTTDRGIGDGVYEPHRHGEGRQTRLRRKPAARRLPQDRRQMVDRLHHADLRLTPASPARRGRRAPTDPRRGPAPAGGAHASAGALPPATG